MSYVESSGQGQSASAHTNTSTKQRSRRSRRPAVQQALTRAVRPVLHVENLEQRTLLSTLPAPVISSYPSVAGSGGSDINQHAPSIAYDPTNPQKLVTVFTSSEPSANGPQKVFIRGAFSRNGGVSWQSFSVPSNLVNPTISPPFEAQIPYIHASHANVGFDNDGQFYVAYLQHNENYDQGAVVLQKYDFSGQSPSVVSEQLNTVLYQWSGHDFAYTPVLVVDNNQPTFTDPDTGAKQDDQWSGNVYVAWGTDNKAPTGAVNFNPNTIRIAASSDGGVSWGPTLLVDGDNSGPDRNGYPKLAVSQGTATVGQATPRVIGGQLTIIYDDFSSGHSQNPPVDFIRAAVVRNGASVVAVQDKQGGAIADALQPPQGSQNHVPVETIFGLDVDIDDPRFVAITDLDVFVSVESDNLADLSFVLEGPNGQRVTLVRNKNLVNGQSLQNGGISGPLLGIVNNRLVPVNFDDQASRRTNDNNASNAYTASFRPETDPTNLNLLSVFNGLTAAQASGTWNLIVTDNRNGSTSQLRTWGIRMHSGLTVSVTNTVAATRVLGANPSTTFPLKPATSPDRGVGPGAVIASDNTLGSFSPNQGRIYVAYTDRVIANGNPSDNTDIFLNYSDDGGSSWKYGPLSGNFPASRSSQFLFGGILVNDDDARDHYNLDGEQIATGDGFSESLPVTFLDTLNDSNPDNDLTYRMYTLRGRGQFMPSITVDQSTGTLVLNWFDARHDPARAQVARYIGTSINGGDDFNLITPGKKGTQTFLNRPNIITDALTGKRVIKGPIPDNQSTQNALRESAFSYGLAQGLVAVGGRVYPVWAGNLNAGRVNQTRLHVQTALATIPAGPRIIKSTMGPVSLSGDTLNPAAPDGSPRFSKFEVEFDRPIDPASFNAASVRVFYRNPTTLGTAPGIGSVNVASVVPLNAGTFGPAGAAGATRFLVNLATPQSAIGTYSYSITPDMRDRVRNLGSTITPLTPLTFNAQGPDTNVRIPLAGNGGSNTNNDFSVSNLLVSGVPTDQVISSLRVTVNLTHPFTDDLVLTLVAPDGRRFILANKRGGSGDNYTNTVFDDAATTSIANGVAPFTGSFIPEQSLRPLTGLNPNGTWQLEIQDTAAGDSGNLAGWSLNITPGQVGPGLGNRVDQNMNASAGEAATASGQGDVLAVPAPTGALPFNGTYFLPPFSIETSPIIIPGPHVVSSAVNGNPITSDNLVLNKPVSNIDVTFDRAMNPATFTPASVLGMIGPVGPIAGPFTVTQLTPTTFRVGFPTQVVSGGYRLTLASSIKSAAGDSLDTNLNAGLDALRVQAINTIDVTVNSSDVPQTIGTKVVNSTINITDAFLIRNATLSLNITYPNVPDLTATLIAPDGTEIILFSNVGTFGVNKANFTNTVFDDEALTPIQNGAAPFSSSFNPQLPLGVLKGKLSTGKWTLQIRSSGVQTGTLNSWSLTLKKPQPETGLGELTADQASVGFRIFTMATGNDLSHQTWTPVGPGSNNENENSGRVGGMAIDPSDPSGNTVYAGGAGGGIWKTTNFLTTDPAGPTWIPLTDFGPTYSLNIGSIAVFGRNGDPNQSIVFAATGNGDTLNTQPNYTSRGVGFLRSMDGGKTWTLLDSTTNVDAQGNPLPINSPQRDHKFVGTSAFKVLVDPKPTPSGDVIVYAALSGANGGVWRSLDSGKTWRNGEDQPLPMRAGQATDIVFDPNSGFFNAQSNPTGNLQYIFAAFQGQGVFFSPNRGTVWNQLLGDVGNPLIRDTSVSPPTAVNPAQPATLPNGNKGRITLAKPHLTGNANLDIQYQGWLYALVSAENGTLDGIYVTKDRGENWTKIRVPRTANGDGGVPSNNRSLSDIPLFGTNGDGNYDQSLEVDPTNPAIVYVGGKLLIRVDTTFLHDAHSFYTDDAAGSGETRGSTNNPVVMRNWLPNGDGGRNAIDQPFINLVRDPNSPFLANATVNVRSALSFTNDGGGVTWTYFDTGSRNEHRIMTMVDPLTGKSRVIAGGDVGIYTGVDNGSEFLRSFGSQTVPWGSRNGNIQLTAYNYGAVQPSNLAAQIAGAMFYGQSNDFNGGAQSAADILTSGNIQWVGPIGSSGGGVATDQTGGGTAYRYLWPMQNGFFNGAVPAAPTDFFMVTPPGSAPGTGIGRTSGLLQDSQPGNTPDPQWPPLIGSNFAVNPVNKDQIIISSQAGRIFATGNQGVIWAAVGNPSALDSSYAPALAYGAPDPAGPGGADAVNFFLYAGTESGKIFVTFNGGGASGNDWKNISVGLDGSPVKAIITNPLRGSHEAYAVTEQGVYYVADSKVASETGGTDWINITGNLKSITHNPFGDPTLAEARVKFLSTIVADWRYAIPDNLNDPTSPTHPALYVGGNGGVYRSFDKGKTWTAFPDQETDSAPAQGGYLPNVSVTDLDLAVGNIDPTTGAPTVAGSPDLLYASTFGRGAYAIRVAPTIVPGTLKLVGTPGGAESLSFSGISQVTAFGNKVRVSLFNLTGGQSTYVAGWNGTDNNTGTDNPANRTNSKGEFSISVPSNAFGPNARVIGVRLTDDAGVTYTGLLTFPPAVPSVPDLVNNSDTGRFNNDNLTNDTTPTFSGSADPGVLVTILVDGTARGTTVADSQGNWQITSTALPAGARNVAATATDIASNVVSAPSSPLVITIDVTAPTAPTGLDMIDASDSGSSNTDNITNVQIPTIRGVAEPNAEVKLYRGGVGNTLLGSAIADATTGEWEIVSASLPNGTHALQATATDVAGNTGAGSTALNVTVDVIVPNVPTAPDLENASDDGASNTDNITTINTPFFTGSADPNMTIELLANGLVVATGTSNAQGAWRLQASALAGGQHSITARARDVAGNQSIPSTALTITITTNVPTPSVPDLTAASDDGASNTDNITSVATPTFTGTGQSGLTIELLIGGNTVVGSAVANSQGQWTITVGSPLSVGTYSFTARAVQGQNVSAQSGALSVDIIAPTVGQTSVPDLVSLYDTGASNTDNITNHQTPTFTGTGPANTLIELLIGGNTVVGSAMSNAQGVWNIVPTNPISEGVHNFTSRAVSGQSTGSQSGALQVTIDITAPPSSGVPDLTAASDTGPSNTDNDTSDNTPTFTGTAPPNTVVDLMVNNTVFGTATSNASGQWTITSSALPNGTYNFTSRTRDIAGNTSALSAGLTVTIRDTPPPPPPLSITSLTLVNADTGKDIFELTEGMQLDLARLPKNLAVRANPAPTNVASVKFGFDVTPGIFVPTYRIESLLPYALFADDANGTIYKPGSFQIGTHKIVATPFSQQRASGIQGTAYTLNFSVINGLPTQQPTVTSFSLINAQTDQVIRTISDGDVLNLKQLPSQLAIRANVTGTPVGSVKFGWDPTPGQFNANYKIESQAPFALFGDGNNGQDYFAGPIVKGNHTLKGQVFSAGGATGQALGSLQISFSVVDDDTQPPPPPPPPPGSGTVTSYSLINAQTDQVIKTLVQGETLDLAQLPSQLAIRANTSGTVGSVRFGFDVNSGQFNSAYKIESQAPYALFGDGNNGTDYFAGPINVGSHTLVGTVFSGGGASGSQTGSLTLNFNVIRSTSSQPTVTSFSLINAATDQVIKTLVQGETLTLSQLPSQLAIRANTSGTVGSVKFGWDPTPGQFNPNFKIESLAPYALFGDGNNGQDYFAGLIAKGSHTLIGTVFSGSGATGQQLGSLTLNFTVV